MVASALRPIEVIHMREGKMEEEAEEEDEEEENKEDIFEDALETLSMLAFNYFIGSKMPLTLYIPLRKEKNTTENCTGSGASLTITQPQVATPKLCLQSSRDAMAGLLLLQGVHGAAEQWKDDDGSLCIRCVCLMSFVGVIMAFCFVKMFVGEAVIFTVSCLLVNEDSMIFMGTFRDLHRPSRVDMATSNQHFSSFDTKQASGQHRTSNMKRAKESMYHALGYSTIVVLQAVMTFEQQDIQNGISAMKDALQTCQKGSLEQLTEEEMHAEICYAECLLQKAALTFVQVMNIWLRISIAREACQDENMINFIKGGLKIRTSYQIYKECLSILHVIQKNKVEQQFFYEFEGGVKLGIGAFNLMLSLLPARIIRLLEFIGFSGNRELGILQLREGALGRSMRSPLCCLTILAFHTYISLILGTGEVNVVEAERLLEPYLQQFPNGSLMLFYHGRIELLKGNVEEAQEIFRKGISVQEEWKQFHHLCYWELMWIFVFQQNWREAYYYSDLLCKESKWSKATYVFLKAAILSMLPEEDVVATKEDVVTLFRQVDGLKQRIAGKSIPTEKFAVRKARRYSPSLPAPVKLILPALVSAFILFTVCLLEINCLFTVAGRTSNFCCEVRSIKNHCVCKEMMYVWNGFPLVSKRKDLSENLLVTVEKAEADLQSENSSDYSVDDECLVKLLKGCCLKNLQRPLQAELCFNHVVQSEKLLKYDHYLVPFTLFELAFLYKNQGEIDKAVKVLETARNNYKDYSLESRLHFRIQAALHLWKKSSSD
ncbi:hypothetical protein E2I00_003573 [Balaenoptera physalus]|uniref:Tetratricopeptide repeat protein 39B n=1 Tax=Balaenoptera physalus TaxID=9770 RepID=A0A643CF31_BALPH|nr:hypothetical protein E2I00_003573 [Balaenoptera physalus]